MLYPGAYLMPHLAGIEGALFSEAGVVGRQITYTIADISSKVIYGVLLTVAAQAMLNISTPSDLPAVTPIAVAVIGVVEVQPTGTPPPPRPSRTIRTCSTRSGSAT